MPVDHTFPQNGDDDYSENFGQLIGPDNRSGYVETGMSFSPTFSTPDVTINSGLAYVKRDTETISAISEDRFDVGYAVQLDQKTISLVDSDVNYIYVNPNLDTDDSATYTSETNQGNAGSEWLLIGEIDTTADTTTALNRNPDGTFATLSIFGDVEGSGSTTIWDDSNQYVPLTSLEEDSVTVAGNIVTLGGSTTIDHADLSTVSDDDHHTYPVPNTGLVNTDITVNGSNGLSGGTASLGGSLTVGSTTGEQLDVASSLSSNLQTTEIDTNNYASLDRIPAQYPGDTLEIYAVSVTNNSFNAPTGLELVIRDATNGVNLDTFNTLGNEGEPITSIDVTGLDVIIAVDNGDFTAGSGSNQIANAHIKYDMV